MPESPVSRVDLEVAAHRERLSPSGGVVPFVSADPGDLRLEDLFSHAGFSWLPLPPIIVDDGSWVSALERLSDADPERWLAVGLNNLGHLGFAAALAERKNIWFFGDFFLYVANPGALAFLLRRVPRLLFAYQWIEEDPGKAAAGPLLRIAEGFRAPLFTGLGCFARHSLHGGSCPGYCPKDYERILRHGRTAFQVIVRDCVTYLFKAP